MNEVGSKSFDLDITSTVLCKIELTEQDFSSFFRDHAKNSIILHSSIVYAVFCL